jgi:medium-chain acyl-[acyl-carrier-protein] hydrolase
METVLTKEYQVRFHEAGFRGTVRPVTVLNYLQDTAAAHSAKCGYPLSRLLARNLTWVLSRYHVHVERYPAVGESITVHTWRPSLEGIFALRDFEVLDCAGKILAAATSSWVIVNLETKRPVKLDTVLNNFPTNKRRALQDEFTSLPRLEKADMNEIFKVRAGDLDLNCHVNHTVYVEWALETVPDDIRQKLFPVEIEAAYRAEAFFGDKILSRTAFEPDENSSGFIHQLVNVRDGKELTRLRTVWRDID